MAHESFKDLIARKKKEGNHRVLTEEDMFGGPEGLARFTKDMKRVRQDYRDRARRSWIRVRDVILD